MSTLEDEQAEKVIAILTGQKLNLPNQAAGNARSAVEEKKKSAMQTESEGGKGSGGRKARKAILEEREAAVPAGSATSSSWRESLLWPSWPNS